jgi:hypothetical protein
MFSNMREGVAKQRVVLLELFETRRGREGEREGDRGRGREPDGCSYQSWLHVFKYAAERSTERQTDRQTLSA